MKRSDSFCIKLESLSFSKSSTESSSNPDLSRRCTSSASHPFYFYFFFLHFERGSNSLFAEGTPRLKS
jgi:hypothetical protein